MVKKTPLNEIIGAENELERLRSRARHNEASALGHARREEREKWQDVIKEKDESHAIELANKDAEIARLREQLDKRT